MKLNDLFAINKFPNHRKISILALRDGYGREIVIPLDLLPDFIRALQAELKQNKTNGLRPSEMFNPYDLDEVAKIDKLIKRRK